MFYDFLGWSGALLSLRLIFLTTETKVFCVLYPLSHELGVFSILPVGNSHSSQACVNAQHFPLILEEVEENGIINNCVRINLGQGKRNREIDTCFSSYVSYSKWFKVKLVNNFIG